MVFIGSFDLFLCIVLLVLRNSSVSIVFVISPYWYRDLLLLFVFLQRLLSASVVRLESSSSRCARAFTP